MQKLFINITLVIASTLALEKSLFVGHGNDSIIPKLLHNSKLLHIR